MADILKISTPLVDKSPMVPNKPVADPNAPFNMADISKVVQTNRPSEILKQNTGMVEQEAPDILMNMMKDPSVTVGFLKNIFMLQEIIKLLSVNNSTLTQEIQQLFDALLITPEDIEGELMRQENTSTAFKGDVFDFLRNLEKQSARPEMRYAVANLLKAVNGNLSQRSILNSLSNSLVFLSNSVESSAALSKKLAELSIHFRAENADEIFPQLKAETMALLKQVEGSVLYTPRLQKILPMVIYNLSRFSDNPDFLQAATTDLLTMMDGDSQKKELVNLLYRFLSEEAQIPRENSKVMDVLASIIGKQTTDVEEARLQERLTDGVGVENKGAKYVNETLEAGAVKTMSESSNLLNAIKNMPKSLEIPPNEIRQLSENGEKLLSAISYALEHSGGSPEVMNRLTDEGEDLISVMKYILQNGDNTPQGVKLIQENGDYMIKLMKQMLENISETPENMKRALENSARALREEEPAAARAVRQAGEEFTLVNGEKIEKIVHSLLSSPCNFTPLLHFIIPVQEVDMKSFAEIWIDPNDEDDSHKYGAGAGAENIHMLIVFDVEGIGRFEAEIFVKTNDISLNLLCPPAYVKNFSSIGTEIARSAVGTQYRFVNIAVAQLERPRSLMDVFKNLPHRRTGIDVKV